ncbi:C45 family autoproteolytic acyltransferase/hydrolase [Streptomyces sp. NBC_00669]|uniref:C45 family peptidase n=1 Tax=Streptomyces sp. NBC_00669 TaxID=2976011 RepID=UPI002E303791|nr:C45 family peptidase [Streptomyces sp. NBC_00669]
MLDHAGRVEKTFKAVDVGDGGDGRWAARVREVAKESDPAKWLTDEGRTPEGAVRAKELFARHMPELLPVLERLAAQVPEMRAGETLLTHAAAKPFWSGCTQTARPGRLLRNYDFPPEACEGTIVRSHFLRPVIGMQDGAWGLLDGMNDAGLAVSLTFGGRFVHGPGLSILIALRYVLETCTTVDEAVECLRGLPICIPQNVTLTDPDRAVTVQVGPDIPLTVDPDPVACAANHQLAAPVSPEEEAGSRTLARVAAIRAAGPDTPVATMLRPPLHRREYDEGFGTLYTADYRPTDGEVGYHWPDAEPWTQSFAAFHEGARTIELAPAPALPEPAPTPTSSAD